MNDSYGHYIFVAIITAILLLVSSSAYGFRCGRKLVTENMHETQVRKVCGTPTTSRDLGYAIRGTYRPVRRHSLPGITTEHFPGYGQFNEQVLLTEYVYNFGPRKFMRRLIFEAGVLVKIEKIGYGYREKETK